MKLHRIAGLLALVLTMVAPCFAHHMAVVVDKDNKVGNLTAAQLSKIFRAEMKNWPGGNAVVIVLQKTSVGEDETLRHLTRLDPKELRELIATHQDSIHMADSDADVLKIVQTTPGAIGLVDVRAVDGSINVVRVDGKLPMEAGYLPH